MNATSMAPPMPTMKGGRPLANVVTCPVFGSTREILPAAPSVTNSAPPGPTVLPDPLARPVTSSVAVGPAASRCPRVPNGVRVARRTAAPKRVSVLVEIMLRLLVNTGREGLEGYCRDGPPVNLRLSQPHTHLIHVARCSDNACPIVHNRRPRMSSSITNYDGAIVTTP